MKLTIAFVYLLLIHSAVVAAGLGGFIESFNGDGPFTNPAGTVEGLDNPDWRFLSDGELRNGGFYMDSGPLDDFDFEHDAVERLVIGSGSFLSVVDLREAFLNEIGEDPPVGSLASMELVHHFDRSGGNFIRLILGEPTSAGGTGWILASLVSSDDGKTEELISRVNRGTDISMGIEFLKESSEYFVHYDAAIDDNVEPERFGPFVYDGRVSEENVARFNTSIGIIGQASVLLDHWSFTPFSNVLGDFNGDERLDAEDIYLLSDAIRSQEISFDITGDSLVNDDDRIAWVHDLKQTYFGDANLDGEFASSDLVNVFAAGEYEDGVLLNSTWTTGDWNGDGEFTTSDLVLAFQDGGYEQGPRVAQSVPEPTSSLGLTLVILSLPHRRRTFDT